MQERPPNQITRVIAVGGVITMFCLIFLVIALSSSSGGGSDGGGDSGTVTSTGPSNDTHTQKALQKGEYTVREGDTMTAISEDTGIDIDTLIELNPDTDPQALIAGRKIKLR